MEVSRYKLEFPAGSHLAPHELEYDSSMLTIPSDTLFSALLAAWIRLGRPAETWLAPFVRGDPPLLISSAFPCVDDEPWFPRPLDFKPDPDWKKVKWVREEEFLAITRG